MSLKSEIIAHIIKVEGGYVNDPHDSGGATKYGITEKVARDYGYAGAMKSLPKSLAEQIYSTRYWDSLKLDDIEAVAPSLAHELADSGVNVGVYQATIWLQWALNGLNRQGNDYPDLMEDGVLGSQTLDALGRYLAVRPDQGEQVLLKALNALQGAHYVTLARTRTKDEDFLFGWLKERVALPPIQ